MVGRFFEPDDKICLIFSNEHYDKLRELPEFAERHDNKATNGSLRNKFHYPNMPRARKWADEFEQGIKAYGISEDQIIRYNDVDWITMNKAIW